MSEIDHRLLLTGLGPWPSVNVRSGNNAQVKDASAEVVGRFPDLLRADVRTMGS